MKKIWPIIALFPLLLFTMQGPLIWLKLTAIDSSPLTIKEHKKTCDSRFCTYEYEASVNKRFALIGHILRSHRVVSMAGDEIYPLGQSKGNQEDTWINLSIYDVSDHIGLKIIAKHPKAASFGPFAGVLPRESDNKEILTVPDISQTISIATQFFAIILLLFGLSAALIASRERPKKFFESSHYLWLVSVVCIGNMAFNSHFFDSLFTSAYIRDLSLRIFALIGLLLPSFQNLKFSKLRFGLVFSGLVSIALVAATNGRTVVSGYSLYSISVLVFVFTSLSVNILRPHFYSAFVIALNLIDAIRMIGYPIPDHPPIYWSQITLSAFALGVAWRQGASDLIPLAKRAYEHIRRDIELLKLSDSIRQPMESSTDLSEVFKKAITKIPSIAMCERCSLLIFLPNENAITISYARDKDQLNEYTDGKVVGQIFTRSLLYGESFWFESLDSLDKKHFKNIKPADQHLDAKYFCAIPIKHNNQVLAVLSCTKFNDKKLEGPGSEITREELRQKIKMISREFEAGLSRRLVAGNNLMRERQKTLQTGIKESVLAYETGQGFLQSICDKLYLASGLRVLLYKRDGHSGILVHYAGLGDHASRWSEKPLNLDPASGNKLGPAIVAFNENKSSYVRDVREIYEHMHPRTIELWEEMDAEEAMTAPIQLGDDQYVLLTFSIRGQRPPDSYWLPAFENVRSFLNSAFMLVEQKSSLSALGKMSARLIGDEAIRDQVMSSALKGEIPTVIGHDVESLILVFDLEGSTNLKGDGEEKAKAYGTFYDKLTIMCSERIGGSVRKTMGDGVIVTTKAPKSDYDAFLQNLISIARDAEKVGISVGGSGTRLAIHYGEYFLGLVGTKTSGTPDIIGRNIDVVCKLEGRMKNYYGDSSPKVSITERARIELFGLDDAIDFDSEKKIGKFLMFKSPDDFLDHCNRMTKKRSA